SPALAALPEARQDQRHQPRHREHVDRHDPEDRDLEVEQQVVAPDHGPAAQHGPQHGHRVGGADARPGAGRRRRAHPFTAPKVSPRIRWRWAKKVKTITGMVWTTAAAATSPRSVPVCCTRVGIITGRVLVSPADRIIANSISFQEKMKTKIATVTR